MSERGHRALPRVIGSRRRRMTVVLQFLTALTLSVVLPWAAGADPQEHWLREMPSVTQVLADVRGPDPLEIAARQIGALRQLKAMTYVVTDNEMGLKKPVSPQQQSIIAAYLRADGEIYAKTIAGFDPADSRRLGAASPQARWIGTVEEYARSQQLEAALLNRYFSPEWRSRYQAVLGASRQRIADRQSQRTARTAQEQARARAEAAQRKNLRSEFVQTSSRQIKILLAIAIPVVILPFVLVLIGPIRSSFVGALLKGYLRWLGVTTMLLSMVPLSCAAPLALSYFERDPVLNRGYSIVIVIIGLVGMFAGIVLVLVTAERRKR
jgi:hypothetical protein